MASSAKCQRCSLDQREPVRRNWVRYFHTPDIWEDDTTEFWRAKPVPDKPDMGESLEKVPLLDVSVKPSESLLDAPVPLPAIELSLPVPASETSPPVPAPEGERLVSAIESERPAPALKAKESPLLQYEPIPWKQRRHGCAHPEDRRQAPGVRRPARCVVRYHQQLEPADRHHLARGARPGEPGRQARHRGDRGGGWQAITGGHNMNAEGSYTLAPVIHDLSVEVVGHGAQLAHDFATSLWDKGHITEFLDGYRYDAASNKFVAMKSSDLSAGRQAAAVVKQYRADPMTADPSYITNIFLSALETPVKKRDQAGDDASSASRSS